MPNSEVSQTTETAAVAEQGAQIAPEAATSKKGASRKKGSPKAKKVVKKTAPKKQAKAAPKATSKEKPAGKKQAKAAEREARDGSKKAAILELLNRKDGATMAEIAKATGWQNHSIRGFISGTLTKKMGLKIESTKSETGERTYRIPK